MSQHYTTNTVSASKWCNQCKRKTLHRVTCGRINDCRECLAGQEEKHWRGVADERERGRIAAKQGRLFA